MAILNFQKQFVPLIKSGKKRQTIREARKHPIKVGETLYLYTDLRTKKAKKIRQVICKSVDKISIEGTGLWLNEQNWHYLQHLDVFAINDGFKDWRELVHWFANIHGLPFEGILIKW